VQSGGQVSVQNLWIDPSNTSVILANTPNGLARTADGAATWQLTTVQDGARSISFDTSNAGVPYVTRSGDLLLKSADYGQTFAPFPVPKGIGEVFPNPIQPCRLIGVGAALYQSTDGSVTWTQESPTTAYDLVADTMNGVYYAAIAGTGITRISANLQTRHFPGEVILLSVRWYLRYSLAYEHVAELLAERGVAVIQSASGAGCRAMRPS
jgi:hypothetical protein